MNIQLENVCSVMYNGIVVNNGGWDFKQRWLNIEIPVWSTIDRSIIINERNKELSYVSLQLTPYLMMNGNAKEAIQFYEKALDAQVLFLQTFGEMPANPEFPLPDEAKGLVSHAMLKVGQSN